MKITRLKYDYIIVGAGILGLAHAIIALERGYSVLLIEKDQQSFGASVQGFGLIWPVSQPSGAALQRSLKSRDKWLDLADKAGFWASQNGSLHLAYHDFEMDILADFSKRYAGKSQILTPDQVLSLSPLVNTVGLKGGLFSQEDMTVDPRKAIYALCNWLMTQKGCDLHFNEQVLHIETGKIATTKSVYEADEIIICNGADFQSLFPKQFANAGLIKVKTQMMRSKPMSERFMVGPSLATGLSMATTTSFQNCKGMDDLRSWIANQMPEYDQLGIFATVSYNRKNELIIGGSHQVNHSFDPYDRVDVNELVLRHIRHYLKVATIPMQQTWHGVYAVSPDSEPMIVKPFKGVTIINGFGRNGLTQSFGFAMDYLPHN